MRILFLLLFATQLSAQTATISGIINRYAAVTAIDTCNASFTVDDTTGFRAGTAVLIFQAQGAQISTGNNGSFGQISNLQSAGYYERAIVDSIAGTTMFMRNRLVHIYSVAGHVQLITLPQYADIVVADTLRAQAWNGATGGILALEVAGTLTLNAPINADGAGFRGGAPVFVIENDCSFILPQLGYYYPLGNWRGGSKGEGIAVVVPNRELGRGPQANGGGGGNDHNSGGGGGANMAAGGRGGENNEPTALGCNGTFPGLGGYPVLNGTDRLFFGGGGGAGHGNNGPTVGGGNGGGIVLIRAANIDGLQPLISANGISADTANGDGGGGGGAGGTIWLETTTAVPDLILRAEGGNGGSTINVNVQRCAGPGAGGSGGRLLTNLTNIIPPIGGQPGVITASSSGCNGGTGDAQAGTAGVIDSLSAWPGGNTAVNLPVITEPLQSTVACSGAIVLFDVMTNTGPWMYQWQMQTDTGGWINLVDDAAHEGVQEKIMRILDVDTSLDSSFYRCIVRLGTCAEVISSTASLRVKAAPVATFSTTQDDLTVSFIGQVFNTIGYIWDFGDSTYSQAANPQHTYAHPGIYIISLVAFNECDTIVFTQTVSLISIPTAAFSVPDSTIGCLSATVTFENLSSTNITNYQWLFPGGTPATSTAAQPSVTYTVSGTYTAQLIVSNLAGQDTISHPFQVDVATFPMADFTYVVNAGGVVAFTNQGLTSNTYTWDFGDGSPLITSFNAAHQYTQDSAYIVTLSASNACGLAVLQQNVIITLTGVATQAAMQLGQVRLFPNPAEDRLTVDCSKTDAQPLDVQLFDGMGRLVASRQKLLSPILEFNLHNWAAGIYTVVIHFEAGQVVRLIEKK